MLHFQKRHKLSLIEQFLPEVRGRLVELQRHPEAKPKDLYAVIPAKTGSEKRITKFFILLLFLFPSLTPSFTYAGPAIEEQDQELSDQITLLDEQLTELYPNILTPTGQIDPFLIENILTQFPEPLNHFLKDAIVRAIKNNKSISQIKKTYHEELDKLLNGMEIVGETVVTNVSKNGLDTLNCSDLKSVIDLSSPTFVNLPVEILEYQCEVEQSLIREELELRIQQAATAFANATEEDRKKIDVKALLKESRINMTRAEELWNKTVESITARLEAFKWIDKTNASWEEVKNSTFANTLTLESYQLHLADKMMQEVAKKYYTKIGTGKDQCLELAKSPEPLNSTFKQWIEKGIPSEELKFSCTLALAEVRRDLIKTLWQVAMTPQDGSFNKEKYLAENGLGYKEATLQWNLAQETSKHFDKLEKWFSETESPTLEATQKIAEEEKIPLTEELFQMLKDQKRINEFLEKNPNPTWIQILDADLRDFFSEAQVNHQQARLEAEEFLWSSDSFLLTEPDQYHLDFYDVFATYTSARDRRDAMQSLHGEAQRIAYSVQLLVGENKVPFEWDYTNNEKNKKAIKLINAIREMRKYLLLRQKIAENRQRLGAQPDFHNSGIRYENDEIDQLEDQYSILKTEMKQLSAINPNLKIDLKAEAVWGARQFLEGRKLNEDSITQSQKPDIKKFDQLLNKIVEELNPSSNEIKIFQIAPQSGKHLLKHLYLSDYMKENQSEDKTRVDALYGWAFNFLINENSTPSWSEIPDKLKPLIDRNKVIKLESSEKALEIIEADARRVAKEFPERGDAFDIYEEVYAILKVEDPLSWEKIIKTDLSERLAEKVYKNISESGGLLTFAKITSAFQSTTPQTYLKDKWPMFNPEVIFAIQVLGMDVAKKQYEFHQAKTLTEELLKTEWKYGKHPSVGHPNSPYFDETLFLQKDSDQDFAGLKIIAENSKTLKLDIAKISGERKKFFDEGRDWFRREEINLPKGEPWHTTLALAVPRILETFYPTIRMYASLPRHLWQQGFNPSKAWDQATTYTFFEHALKAQRWMNEKIYWVPGASATGASPNDWVGLSQWEYAFHGNPIAKAGQAIGAITQIPTELFMSHNRADYSSDTEFNRALKENRNGMLAGFYTLKTAEIVASIIILKRFGMGIRGPLMAATGMGITAEFFNQMYKYGESLDDKTLQEGVLYVLTHMDPVEFLLNTYTQTADSMLFMAWSGSVSRKVALAGGKATPMSQKLAQWTSRAIDFDEATGDGESIAKMARLAKNTTQFWASIGLASVNTYDSFDAHINQIFGLPVALTRSELNKAHFQVRKSTEDYSALIYDKDLVASLFSKELQQAQFQTILEELAEQTKAPKEDEAGQETKPKLQITPALIMAELSRLTQQFVALQALYLQSVKDPSLLKQKYEPLLQEFHNSFSQFQAELQKQTQYKIVIEDLQTFGHILSIYGSSVIAKKHAEQFLALLAKYMTLHPKANSLLARATRIFLQIDSPFITVLQQTEKQPRDFDQTIALAKAELSTEKNGIDSDWSQNLTEEGEKEIWRIHEKIGTLRPDGTYSKRDLVLKRQALEALFHKMGMDPALQRKMAMNFISNYIVGGNRPKSSRINSDSITDIRLQFILGSEDRYVIGVGTGGLGRELIPDFAPSEEARNLLQEISTVNKQIRVKHGGIFSFDLASKEEIAPYLVEKLQRIERGVEDRDKSRKILDEYVLHERNRYSYISAKKSFQKIHEAILAQGEKPEVLELTNELLKTFSDIMLFHDTFTSGRPKSLQGVDSETLEYLMVREVFGEEDVIPYYLLNAKATAYLLWFALNDIFRDINESDLFSARVGNGHIYHLQENLNRLIPNAASKIYMMRLASPNEISHLESDSNGQLRTIVQYRLHRIDYVIQSLRSLRKHTLFTISPMKIRECIELVESWAELSRSMREGDRSGLINAPDMSWGDEEDVIRAQDVISIARITIALGLKLDETRKIISRLSALKLQINDLESLNLARKLLDKYFSSARSENEFDWGGIQADVADSPITGETESQDKLAEKDKTPKDEMLAQIIAVFDGSSETINRIIKGLGVLYSSITLDLPVETVDREGILPLPSPFDILDREFIVLGMAWDEIGERVFALGGDNTRDAIRRLLELEDNIQISAEALLEAKRILIELFNPAMTIIQEANGPRIGRMEEKYPPEVRREKREEPTPLKPSEYKEYHKRFLKIAKLERVELPSDELFESDGGLWKWSRKILSDVLGYDEHGLDKFDRVSTGDSTEEFRISVETHFMSEDEKPSSYKGSLTLSADSWFTGQPDQHAEWKFMIRNVREAYFVLEQICRIEQERRDSFLLRSKLQQSQSKEQVGEDNKDESGQTRLSPAQRLLLDVHLHLMTQVLPNERTIYTSGSVNGKDGKHYQGLYRISNPPFGDIELYIVTSTDESGTPKVEFNLLAHPPHAPPALYQVSGSLEELSSSFKLLKSLVALSSTAQQDFTFDEQLAENTINKAKERKWKNVTQHEQLAIEIAHKVGEGEKGNDVRPAGIYRDEQGNLKGNFTKDQLRRKQEILYYAGFSFNEIRELIEAGVVGGSQKGYKNADNIPPSISTQARILAEALLRNERVDGSKLVREIILGGLESIGIAGEAKDEFNNLIDRILIAAGVLPEDSVKIQVHKFCQRWVDTLGMSEKSAHEIASALDDSIPESSKVKQADMANATTVFKGFFEMLAGDQSLTEFLKKRTQEYIADLVKKGAFNVEIESDLKGGWKRNGIDSSLVELDKIIPIEVDLTSVQAGVRIAAERLGFRGRDVLVFQDHMRAILVDTLSKLPKLSEGSYEQAIFRMAQFLASFEDSSPVLLAENLHMINSGVNHATGNTTESISIAPLGIGIRTEAQGSSNGRRNATSGWNYALFQEQLVASLSINITPYKAAIKEILNDLVQVVDSGLLTESGRTALSTQEKIATLDAWGMAVVIGIISQKPGAAEATLEVIKDRESDRNKGKGILSVLMDALGLDDDDDSESDDSGGLDYIRSLGRGSIEERILQELKSNGFNIASKSLDEDRCQNIDNDKLAASWSQPIPFINEDQKILGMKFLTYLDMRVALMVQSTLSVDRIRYFKYRGINKIVEAFRIPYLQFGADGRRAYLGNLTEKQEAQIREALLKAGLFDYEVDELLGTSNGVGEAQPPPVAQGENTPQELWNAQQTARNLLHVFGVVARDKSEALQLRLDAASYSALSKTDKTGPIPNAVLEAARHFGFETDELQRLFHINLRDLIQNLRSRNLFQEDFVGITSRHLGYVLDRLGKANLGSSLLDGKVLRLIYELDESVIAEFTPLETTARSTEIADRQEYTQQMAKAIRAELGVLGDNGSSGVKVADELVPKKILGENRDGPPTAEEIVKKLARDDDETIRLVQSVFDLRLNDNPKNAELGRDEFLAIHRDGYDELKDGVYPEHVLLRKSQAARVLLISKFGLHPQVATKIADELVRERILGENSVFDLISNKWINKRNLGNQVAAVGEQELENLDAVNFQRALQQRVLPELIPFLKAVFHEDTSLEYADIELIRAILEAAKSLGIELNISFAEDSTLATFDSLKDKIGYLFGDLSLTKEQSLDLFKGILINLIEKVNYSLRDHKSQMLALLNNPDDLFGLFAFIATHGSEKVSWQDHKLVANIIFNNLSEDQKRILSSILDITGEKTAQKSTQGVASIGPAAKAVASAEPAQIGAFPSPVALAEEAPGARAARIQTLQERFAEVGGTLELLARLDPHGLKYLEKSEDFVRDLITAVKKVSKGKSADELSRNVLKNKIKARNADGTKIFYVIKIPSGRRNQKALAIAWPDTENKRTWVAILKVFKEAHNSKTGGVSADLRVYQQSLSGKIFGDDWCATLSSDAETKALEFKAERNRQRAFAIQFQNRAKIIIQKAGEYFQITEAEFAAATGFSSDELRSLREGELDLELAERFANKIGVETAEAFNSNWKVAELDTRDSIELVLSENTNLNNLILEKKRIQAEIDLARKRSANLRILARGLEAWAVESNFNDEELASLFGLKGQGKAAVVRGFLDGCKSDSNSSAEGRNGLAGAIAKFGWFFGKETVDQFADLLQDEMLRLLLDSPNLHAAETTRNVRVATDTNRREKEAKAEAAVKAAQEAVRLKQEAKQRQDEEKRRAAKERETYIELKELLTKIEYLEIIRLIYSLGDQFRDAGIENDLIKYVADKLSRADRVAKLRKNLNANSGLLKLTDLEVVGIAKRSLSTRPNFELLYSRQISFALQICPELVFPEILKVNEVAAAYKEAFPRIAVQIQDGSGSFAERIAELQAQLQSKVAQLTEDRTLALIREDNDSRMADLYKSHAKGEWWNKLRSVLGGSAVERDSDEMYLYFTNWYLAYITDDQGFQERNQYPIKDLPRVGNRYYYVGLLKYINAIFHPKGGEISTDDYLRAYEKIRALHDDQDALDDAGEGQGNETLPTAEEIFKKISPFTIELIKELVAENETTEDPNGGNPITFTRENIIRLFENREMFRGLFALFTSRVFASLSTELSEKANVENIRGIGSTFIVRPTDPGHVEHVKSECKINSKNMNKIKEENRLILKLIEGLENPSVEGNVQELQEDKPPVEGKVLEVEPEVQIDRPTESGGGDDSAPPMGARHRSHLGPYYAYNDDAPDNSRYNRWRDRPNPTVYWADGGRNSDRKKSRKDHIGPQSGDGTESPEAAKEARIMPEIGAPKASAQNIPQDLKLNGRIVDLAALEENDFDALIAIRSDPETMKWLEFISREPDAIRTRLSGFLSAQRSNNAITTTIRTKDGTIIGNASLRINWADRSADFGIVINHAYWGMGYDTETRLFMLDYAFNTLLLEKITFETPVANPRTNAIHQSLGLGITEVKPAQDGKPALNIYAITRADWPRVKRVLEVRFNAKQKMPPVIIEPAKPSGSTIGPALPAAAATPQAPVILNPRLEAGLDITQKGIDKLAKPIAPIEDPPQGTKRQKYKKSRKQIKVLLEQAKVIIDLKSDEQYLPKSKVGVVLPNSPFSAQLISIAKFISQARVQQQAELKDFINQLVTNKKIRLPEIDSLNEEGAEIYKTWAVLDRLLFVAGDRRKPPLEALGMLVPLYVDYCVQYADFLIKRNGDGDNGIAKNYFEKARSAISGYLEKKNADNAKRRTQGATIDEADVTGLVALRDRLESRISGIGSTETAPTPKVKETPKAATGPPATVSSTERHFNDKYEELLKALASERCDDILAGYEEKMGVGARALARGKTAAEKVDYEKEIADYYLLAQVLKTATDENDTTRSLLGTNLRKVKNRIPVILKMYISKLLKDNGLDSPTEKQILKIFKQQQQNKYTYNNLNAIRAFGAEKYLSFGDVEYQAIEDMHKAGTPIGWDENGRPKFSLAGIFKKARIGRAAGFSFAEIRRLMKLWVVGPVYSREFSEPNDDGQKGAGSRGRQANKTPGEWIFDDLNFDGKVDGRSGSFARSELNWRIESELMWYLKPEDKGAVSKLLEAIKNEPNEPRIAARVFGFTRELLVRIVNANESQHFSVAEIGDISRVLKEYRERVENLTAGELYSLKTELAVAYADLLDLLYIREVEARDEVMAKYLHPNSDNVADFTNLQFFRGLSGEIEVDLTKEVKKANEDRVVKAVMRTLNIILRNSHEGKVGEDLTDYLLHMVLELIGHYPTAAGLSEGVSRFLTNACNAAAKINASEYYVGSTYNLLKKFSERNLGVIGADVNLLPDTLWFQSLKLSTNLGDFIIESRDDLPDLQMSILLNRLTFNYLSIHSLVSDQDGPASRVEMLSGSEGEPLVLPGAEITGFGNIMADDVLGEVVVDRPEADGSDANERLRIIGVHKAAIYGTVQKMISIVESGKALPSNEYWALYSIYQYSRDMQGENSPYWPSEFYDETFFEKIEGLVSMHPLFKLGLIQKIDEREGLEGPTRAQDVPNRLLQEYEFNIDESLDQLDILKRLLGIEQFNELSAEQIRAWSPIPEHSDELREKLEAIREGRDARVTEGAKGGVKPKSEIEWLFNPVLDEITEEGLREKVKAALDWCFKNPGSDSLTRLIEIIDSPLRANLSLKPRIYGFLKQLFLKLVKIDQANDKVRGILLVKLQSSLETFEALISSSTKLAKRTAFISELNIAYFRFLLLMRTQGIKNAENILLSDFDFEELYRSELGALLFVGVPSGEGSSPYTSANDAISSIGQLFLLAFRGGDNAEVNFILDMISRIISVFSNNETMVIETGASEAGVIKIGAIEAQTIENEVIGILNALPAGLEELSVPNHDKIVRSHTIASYFAKQAEIPRALLENGRLADLFVVNHPLTDTLRSPHIASSISTVANAIKDEIEEIMEGREDTIDYRYWVLARRIFVDLVGLSTFWGEVENGSYNTSGADDETDEDDDDEDEGGGVAMQWRPRGEGVEKGAGLVLPNSSNSDSFLLLPTDRVLKRHVKKIKELTKKLFLYLESGKASPSLEYAVMKYFTDAPSLFNKEWEANKYFPQEIFDYYQDRVTTLLHQHPLYKLNMFPDPERNTTDPETSPPESDVVDPELGDYMNDSVIMIYLNDLDELKKRLGAEKFNSLNKEQLRDHLNRRVPPSSPGHLGSG